MRHVIFIRGPVGAGKTTLGRALAENLHGTFIDSDDHRNPRKKWYEESLTTSRSVVRAGLEALLARPILVIAKPLRARDWCYFCGQLGKHGIRTWCVTLSATVEGILDPKRGRHFNAYERSRVAGMLAEGYGSRPFSSLIITSDIKDFSATVAELTSACRALLGADQGGRPSRLHA
jgi:AAA domain